MVEHICNPCTWEADAGGTHSRLAWATQSEPVLRGKKS
jgi:hypothetical protein